MGNAGNIKAYLRRIKKMLQPERVALALSMLYVVGVILLLQYNSIFFGDIDFDFIRVKPIVVGCEYFLYLAFPVVVVFLPILLTSRRYMGWFWCWLYSGDARGNFLRRRKIWGVCLHVFICLFESAILAFLIGLMFHYFLPYVEHMLSDEHRFPGRMSIVSLLLIACAFWRIYCCLDISLLAFVCLFVVALLWTLQHCGYVVTKSTARRRFYYLAIIILLPFAFLTNMFYFVRDVYPNISQAAGGGAPVSGIITIESAGEQFRLGVDGVSADGSDVTKFCSVVQTSAEFWYIDEQLISDRGAAGGTHARLRTKTTRVRKADIKQFTPVSIPMFYQYGHRTMLGQDVLYDYIHNLDMFIEVGFSATGHNNAIRGLWFFNTTNEVSVVGALENFPAFRLRASNQRVVKDGPTSLNYIIDVRHLPVSTMSLVTEFMMAITNETQWFAFEVSNLPPIPKYLTPTNFSLGFVINYAKSLVAYQSPSVEYGPRMIISRHINEHHDANNNTQVEDGRQLSHGEQSDKLIIAQPTNKTAGLFLFRR